MYYLHFNFKRSVASYEINDEKATFGKFYKDFSAKCQYPIKDLYAIYRGKILNSHFYESKIEEILDDEDKKTKTMNIFVYEFDEEKQLTMKNVKI